MAKFEKKEITKKSENISQWYNDIVLKAQLADYAPVKGTMVIRPYGYAIWEEVQGIFNKLMKAKGVQNAYFPLFIPHSLLEKEKEHVEGFSPELAIVTVGGGEDLKDPLVVRPTSETIMYQMYSQWVQSWRDLPILINQWNNVVRWEKRTYLFLRTTEFLWQEGHTAHETENEAIEMAKTALEWYRKIYEEYYGIPVILGTKSEAERFAGAKTTYTVEALMPDGKALQGATSHNLGQNFSKVFEIDFQDREGKKDYAWQTSWGMSTRSIGALILVHGDDDGLVLPPNIAPIKVVILPIFGKEDEKVLAIAQKIKESIEKIFPFGVQVWDDSSKTLGWRTNEAEMRGIPIVIPLGPKELEQGSVWIHSRLSHKFGDQESIGKREVKLENITDEVGKLAENLQKALFERAQVFLKENTNEVGSYDEFKNIMSTKRGFIKAFWCENAQCEKRIKEETKATTRCLPLAAKEEKGNCIYCGNEAKYRWLFAQAY